MARNGVYDGTEATSGLDRSDFHIVALNVLTYIERERRKREKKKMKVKDGMRDSYRR